ncbi:MAG: AAA family ATPase [Planctomycetaceae bacterium]|jgi:hypothetical protein|nr:AAA family ATPase [Planctomycetaceae bacterium]
MFEEYSLTSPRAELKDELPLLRIGSIERNSALIPVLLPFDELNGFCFETNHQTRNDAIKQMQYMSISLLKQVQPDLLRLFFVDIGLATNFPLIHSLKVLNIHFITNHSELKEKMRDLFETARHISTCLGGEYSNLKDYNKENPNNKEPYNVLFIANFPSGLDEEAIKMVGMLVADGMNCGIRVVMNLEKAFFPKIDLHHQAQIAEHIDLRRQMVYLDCTQPKIVLNRFNVKAIQDLFIRYSFVFESYSSEELLTLAQTINETYAEKESKYENFLCIPIGRCGRESVCLEMGQRSGVYHGFIAGQTGTGKSTLLNNIITSIAEKYSPDEMRLYLLDYKHGVEFQKYQDHPNVELLLLDNSNLPMGVESLRRLRQEMTRRAQLFRELGVTINSIEEYNRKSLEKLPRILLIIDEVQQLFVNFDIRRLVNPLVSEIARQGRAFGVHMLFSSQSYVDCRIDEDILTQMSLRIAYALANNNECRAILKVDNTAPTELRLSEYKAVYNQQNGDSRANRIVKMDDFDTTKIIELLATAEEKHKGYRPFNKQIFVKNEETPECYSDKPAKNLSLGTKTATRNLNVNNNEYGF